MKKLFFGSLCIILIYGCEKIKPKSIVSDTSEVAVIKGTATYSGSILPLDLVIDKQGRFICKIGGWVNQTTGYDGEKLWRIENGVGPYIIDFAEKELMKAVHWPLIENWKTFDDIIISRDTLQLKDGLLQLSMDYKDGALNQLIAVNSPYKESITFKGVLREKTNSIPKEINIETGFPLTFYSFESIKKITKPSGWYEKPPYLAAGVSFDSQVSPELEVRQTETGHLFIKPKIQGKDLGWFLFDSGAGISMIDSKIAHEFNTTSVGRQKIGGVGGQTAEEAVIQLKNIKLGPLEVEQLNFVLLGNTSRKANEILGEPVAGVLGWDVLLRVVMELDMGNGKISIYDPSKYNLDQKYSEQLFLHWNVPYVKSSFEGDKQGMFLIDTGAGNHGPIFHSLAVRRLGLLEGRETEKGIRKGAGGEVTVQNGKLEWFEIAGHRTNQVSTTFMLGNDGEADLYTDGFIGGEVIKPLKIVFDYSNNQIGFLPK